MEICGDAAKVGEWLGEPVARAEFQIDWVDDDDPGLSAVHFSTGTASSASTDAIPRLSRPTKIPKVA